MLLRVLHSLDRTTESVFFSPRSTFSAYILSSSLQLQQLGVVWNVYAVMAFVSQASKMQTDSTQISPIFTCHTRLPMTGYTPSAVHPQPQRDNAKLGRCLAMLSTVHITPEVWCLHFVASMDLDDIHWNTVLSMVHLLSRTIIMAIAPALRWQ